MTKSKASAEDSAPQSEATSASVYSSTGGLIRVYSVADHGENFADLAKEFVEHTPGATITLA